MFYVIKVLKDNEGKITKSMYNYDNIDSAKVRYHTDLASNINKSDLSYVLCSVINADGYTVMAEVWRAPEEVENE